jgi:hypothetical protein
MQYRRCGRSGLLLPAISLGLWHNFGAVDSFRNVQAMLRRAFDLGITHFDLANNYGPPPGSAEQILAAFSTGWLGHVARAVRRLGFAQISSCQLGPSLERMNLEHVDIFYSHRPDPKTPIEETMSALDYAVRSGKALYAGISSYGAKQTEVSANALRRLGTRRVGPGSRTPSRSQIPDVHIRVRFTRLRHHDRIVPGPEIVHAVRTFGHRKERFPIRSFHARAVPAMREAICFS